MGIYKGYFRHNGTLKRALRGEDGTATLDKYGNPAYSSAIPIKCFKTVETVPIVTEAGTVYAQKRTYYVDGSISMMEGDLLDGLQIDSLSSYLDLQGKLQYRVATIKEG